MGSVCARIAAALLALALLLVPDAVRAGCNLIGIAAKESASTNGYVDRAVAGPGQKVTLRTDTACHPERPGFAPPGSNTPNIAELIFYSPADNQPVSVVEVPTENLVPKRCGGLRCELLEITIPDTDALVPPEDDGLGLTGPTEIRVRRAGQELPVAVIFELYQERRSCDETVNPSQDPFFGTFTVLPPPNVLPFGTSANPGPIPAVYGAVDGLGNVVIPFDFSQLLQAPAGSSVATVLRVVSANAAILAALQTASDSDISSYNDFGRPIPPFLQLIQEPLALGGVRPGFVGTTDVVTALMQVKPVGAPPLDYPNRMLANENDERVGAVELLGGSVEVRTATPLSALRTSLQAVAVGADESRFGDLDGDGNASHLVTGITNVTTGIETNTMLPLTEVGSPKKPALVTNGDVVVFYESESLTAQTDRNGDLDEIDQIAQIWRLTGTTSGADGYTIAAGDPAPLVDERPFAITRPLLEGVPTPFAVFRRIESGRDRAVTQRVSREELGADLNAVSLRAAISADGAYVAFDSAATNFGHVGSEVYLFDRNDSSTRLMSLSTDESDGDGASRDAAISADGEVVAFESFATNLVSPPLPGDGDSQIFLRLVNYCGDCGDDAIALVSRDDNDAPGNGASENPSVCRWFGDHYVVAFESAATNLEGDANAFVDGFFAYVHFDGSPGSSSVDVRRLEGSAAPNGASHRPVLSADCNHVAFSSSATNLAGAGEPENLGFEDVFVASFGFDEGGPFVTDIDRISVDPTRAPGDPLREANGRSIQPAISADGRFVAFASAASNLVPDDSNGRVDIFVYDRETKRMQRANLKGNGAQDDFADAFWPAISGDGSVVSFRTRQHLDDDDSDSQDDAYRKNWLTGAIDRIARSDLNGTPSNDEEADADSETNENNRSALSQNGRFAAFASQGSNLISAGDVTNGVDDTNGLIDIFVRGTGDTEPSLNVNTPWTDLGDPEFDDDVDDTVVQIVDVGALGPSGPVSAAILDEATVAADEVHVSDGRVLTLVDEHAERGDYSLGEVADNALNGDNDTEDDVAFLFDVRDQVLRNSGFAVDAGREMAALSAQAVCLGVSEWGQTYANLNGDFDNIDDVLHAGDPAAFPTLVNTGLAVTAVGATGSLCVALRPEASEPGSGFACEPPGCNLNDDADALDQVMTLYDRASGTPVNLGIAAADFEVSEANPDLIAFRACEADAAPGTDFNLDGDSVDCVMQVYQESSDTLINTRLEAIPCTFDACEAFELYRIGADNTLSFLGTEPGQENDATGAPSPVGCLRSLANGCDMTGDRDDLDVVVHVLKIGNGVVAARQTYPFSDRGQVDPFPVAVVDESVLHVSSDECQEAVRHCCGLQGTDPSDPLCAPMTLGETFPYLPGSCASQFDTDPDGDSEIPTDTAGALDCVTDRVWIVGDVDGDGVRDVASNDEDDTCIAAANPDQTDADGDRLGDEVCDGVPDSSKPGELDCDMDGDQHVDAADVALIFDAVGRVAAGFPELGWDRRDRPGPGGPDGVISALDAALCSQACDCGVTCAATCEPELVCDDERDNDGDGALDCDDSDCETATECVGPASIVACGLLGIEPLGVLALAALRRKFLQRKGRAS